MKSLLMSMALIAASLIHSSAADNSATESADALPLTKIVLYSSGVGFFERQGEVDGAAEVRLQFTPDQVNDLLKSLFIMDPEGGLAEAVTYDSRAPLEKTLGSFALDLTGNPSIETILQQARGARIRVFPNAAVLAIFDRNPRMIEGRVISVEQQEEVVENAKASVAVLNLLTSDGITSMPLKHIQRFEFLDAQLQSELQQALELLAGAQSSDRKTVTLRFVEGVKREVVIGYVVEAPIWKTSYRLVLGDGEDGDAAGAYLQGWAIVENPSDHDWKDVDLTLVSGRPISFTMDLYEPLFVERPKVELELFENLRPKDYGMAMDKSAPPPAAAAPAAAGYALAASTSRGRVLRQEVQEEAKRVNQDWSAGFESAAQGAEAGELFRYDIESPVTLNRRKSAMIPILSSEIEGEKLSIYTAGAAYKHPMNGYRLKNTSGLHLMQGPVTVVEDGIYAGDAQLGNVPLGEERLLSYGLDLKREVTSTQEQSSGQVVEVWLKKGVLTTARKYTRATTYEVKNRGDETVKVLVEHPIAQGWELTSPEPAEKTGSHSRFVVEPEAGALSKVVVDEIRRISEEAQLVDLDVTLIGFYLRNAELSEAVRQALQRYLEMRDELNATLEQINRAEQQVQTIGEEQQRIRENMERLDRTTELYGRYLRKLNDQETELEDLRQTISELKDQESRQRMKIGEYLSGLELE